VTFRTRLFVTSVATAALTLGVATFLVSWSLRRSLNDQIERGLVNETRLAAATLSHRRAGTPAELDAEADSLGGLISARVTFISADGRVVGDSALELGDLSGVENHAGRPEVGQARRDGLGTSRRYSSTVDAEMLYAAVPVVNPQAPDLAFVRLALPLVDVRREVAAVRRSALLAFGAGLVGALALAWITSVFLSRRVRAIATVAARYAAGDLSRPARHYGDDEIGTVARVLERSVRELGMRVAELDSSRARMEAILGGMVEGVLVVDELGRLRLVNDAARRMLNLQGLAPEGLHYLEIIRHPEIAAQITAALNGQSPEGQELTLPRDPGVIFMARSAPVTSSTARGAVLVLHDITDLRRADRIRRDFVANVSHELRTPLTAVRGYVEALLDGELDAGQVKQFLDIIARHTLRMERLVHDLLRLARLDARQEAPDRAPCAVASLFAAVTEELEPAIEARRQTVEYRVAPDASTVDGDPAKLHDALRNLLENATNYSPEGSTITMASERRDDAVALAVEDEGPGIPEADLPRIFERFYRVDRARSRGGPDPGGTGLGLAIVKHLVELHGGKVIVANRPEKGAVFTVELPD
jgi:two-component system phosphate regulon sensor histidine kinase PhoR